MSPNGGGGGDTDDNPLSTYETELSALHDSIGQLVQVMLTDSVNAVKQVEIHSKIVQGVPYCCAPGTRVG